MAKPFSQACENNKQPILNILQTVFASSGTVLEIGSGTGQHAVFFAGHMPHLNWQTSDQHQYHQGIKLWLDDARLNNLQDPLELDVSQPHWPVDEVDGVFSANTLHIMSWSQVTQFFAGCERILADQANLCVYGPFNYHGQYTSESNAAFDQHLRLRDPASGIRDFEAVDQLARQAGLSLIKDYPMPANNRLLHWRKSSK